MALRAKHQRLVLALVALLAVVGAGVLASLALKDQASYFYTPAEARAATIVPGEAARLGGMVQTGSIERQADGVTIEFILTDGRASVPVRYTGITPDLFGEGQGAVADGRFEADGTFVADRILAKHDERYMPPQMGDMPANAGQGTLDSASVAPVAGAPAGVAR